MRTHRPELVDRPNEMNSNSQSEQNLLTFQMLLLSHKQGIRWRLENKQRGTPSEGTPRSTSQGGFNGSLSHLHTCTPKQGMSYHQERGENTTCAPPGKMDVESTGWTRKWRQHQSWDSLAWWHWIVGSHSGKEGTMRVLALLPWEVGVPIQHPLVKVWNLGFPLGVERPTSLFHSPL